MNKNLTRYSQNPSSVTAQGSSYTPGGNKRRIIIFLSRRAAFSIRTGSQGTPKRPCPLCCRRRVASRPPYIPKQVSILRQADTFQSYSVLWLGIEQDDPNGRESGWLASWGCLSALSQERGFEAQACCRRSVWWVVV